MQLNLIPLQLPAAVGWLVGWQDCPEQDAQLSAFLKLPANYLLPFNANRRGFLAASKAHVICPVYV